jgi:nucleotide-binding universal stress UspA family protein
MKKNNQKKRTSKTDETSQIKKVEVATDFSPNSLRAAQVAMKLAKANSAELIVLHIIQNPAYHLYAPRAFGTPPIEEYLDHAEKEARKWAESILEEARAKGITARLEILRTKSSIVSAIIDNATGENADLIVIGTRGLGGFRKLLQGSVSSGVVTHAPCDVLVVR